LRLSKEGDDYTLSWSADGDDWTLIEESRSIELDDPAFGLYATGSTAQETPVTVSFDHFELLDEEPVDPPLECEGTVVINGEDSGVDDRPIDDETCLSDAFGDRDDHRNHGQFVRHVRSVVAALIEDEIITGEEGRALERAASRSAGGGPPHTPPGHER
jgi:hypothetical protein